MFGKKQNPHIDDTDVHRFMVCDRAPSANRAPAQFSKAINAQKLAILTLKALGFLSRHVA